ncbi:MAG TPA: tRNA guanosine(34) transglycosylase Tgt [Candidatus Limnocylindria bacterium]|nr:tRNA guanosine(34) transglycosylase Tgt [Candidatus Limnocylindria bacterium]
MLNTAAAARRGELETPHGIVETPAFMAVGTLATVKSLDPRELREAGAQMILANAYHLHLRPGDELLARLGGLHRFMGWDGPILTDSGGFQVFSLAQLRTVEEDGVEFRSHIDGSSRRFTPESVMQIERNLGADVIMQFDHVIPGQSDAASSRDASERSLRWLARCRQEHGRLAQDDPAEKQALFPIVQGGIHQDLRREAARAVTDMGDWHGFGIGGLSVGEEKPAMYEMLEVVDDVLPKTRPRYLMGVGFPADLIEAVRRGVDLFDCVAPTRMGRNGTAFVPDGRINVRNAELKTDHRPLDESCGCPTCTRFSRAYLRHLFTSDEMLGPRLLSLHNVHFLVRLMRTARETIRDGTFDAWSRDWLQRHNATPSNPRTGINAQ